MSPVQLVHLTTHLGPKWVAFRAGYALERRTRYVERRSPCGAWEDYASPAGTAEPIRLFHSAPRSIGAGAVADGDEILAGRHKLFGFHRFEEGLLPDWHRNPFTGQRVADAVHWSRISDARDGDIKAVWELSRFPWAWSLARAWRKTGDERYAEAFWSLCEDWMRRNPPNTGPNWMCGQEATFRLMALVFARDVLADAVATTPARVRGAESLIRATGKRIAANLRYGLSQRNNHGVSESVGLITCALLVPGAPGSASWRRRGLAALQAQLEELVYADGAFAQHSANYHRVLLHDCLWCITVLRAAGETPPPWLLDAARRALLFLDAIVTESTGRTPLYGANDGANVLPLSDCDYLDFRPVVQTGYALLEGVRRFVPGPWDEAADWLAGTDAMRLSTAGSRPSQLHARQGGCLLWRSGTSRLFLRCPERFAHRPSQADLLHADIEIRGQPVAIDAGTFSYNTTGRFAGAMKEAALHNTVVIDGREPMQKAGRFLYLPWPRGRAAWDEKGQRFTAARHDGHTRVVSSPSAEQFLIRDEITKQGRHVARLQWLLADLSYVLDAQAAQLRLQTSQGGVLLAWQASGPLRVSLVRADQESPRGWWSPYYLQALPALSLVMEIEFDGTAWLETRFAPAA